MNYYDRIDPIGQSQDEYNECNHCGTPDTSYKGYCSKACYNYDLY